MILASSVGRKGLPFLELGKDVAKPLEGRNEEYSL
jgi:hypothetical protein